MAFTIYIRNDGETGTVTVSQWINPNERKDVFKDIIDAGVQKPATAYFTQDDKDDRGVFEWHHAGSNTSGREVVRADDILRVN